VGEALKIGIDIGNVIIGGDGEDTFFTEKFLDTPQVDGAFHSIKAIVDAGHAVYLISKCGTEVQAKTWDWLDHFKFFEKTGVSASKVYFVHHRMDKQPVAKALSLDVFIDDRRDILQSMALMLYPILFESWETTNQSLRYNGIID
jgi:hypothetical protein